MFYGGMEYSPTTNQTSYNSIYNYQDDASSTQPGQPEQEKGNSDTKLDSIYSCDSILDDSDYTDCDDDDDEFDNRVKQYLEEHGKEMQLPMADPRQQYAQLKVAQVLSRGTLSGKRTRRKLEKLKKSLPPYKFVTPDYQEALDLLKVLNSYVNKRRDTMSKEQMYIQKKRCLEKLTAEKIQWINCDSKDSHPKTKRKKYILDVRKFLKDLVSSSSEDEKDLHDYESSGDESIDFTELHKLKFLFPQEKTEEKKSSNCLIFKPNTKSTSNCSCTSNCSTPKIKRPSIKATSSWRNFKNQRCSKAEDPNDLKIAKKKLIILYKKVILHRLKHYAFGMQEDKELMKHKMFRVWSNRQKDGIEKIERDLKRRKARLNLRIQRVQQQRRIKQMCPLKKAIEKKMNKPIILPRIQDAKHKRWTKTSECMHEREKLLMEKQGTNFLAGFLGDRAKIRTKRSLKKEMPEMPSNIGVPPPPPRTNKKILKTISMFMEAKLPIMTYGDLLRILEGDTSFILNDEGVMDIEESETSDSKQQGVGSPSNNHRCREWDDFIKNDKDINFPFLTKHELKKYLNMVNTKFFPDPNFELAEELVSVDEKALDFEEPGLLKMNYSLEELEKDTYRAENVECAQSRAIYFFQYKSGFTPIDIQAAYEEYLDGNVGLRYESLDRLKGCLLIYSNVKLAIVMIEGSVDHLFYHFAGFRNSRLIKFIEIGRVLYAYERVTRILNEWVSIVMSPPPGEITYFTNSKKILHRVAEPRVQSLKTKLHNLYSYLSKKFEAKSKYRDRGDWAMPSNMKSQLNPCPCYQSEPNERKSGFDLSPCTDCGKGDNDSVHDLIPSPALIGYLLKYKKLTTIEKFLDEFVCNLTWRARMKGSM
uniref:Uncharacterized protein n=2 Tax=Lygus hesperus TaxID=30085 RepID=A0A0K8T599_LYGHE